MLTSRPIKFRGVDKHSGEYVFGDFIQRGPLMGHPDIIDYEDFYHEIKPESLAQLCGEDNHGGEVYERDILLDELEQEHVAEIYDRPAVLSQLTLKVNHNA